MFSVKVKVNYVICRRQIFKGKFFSILTKASKRRFNFFFFETLKINSQKYIEIAKIRRVQRLSHIQEQRQIYFQKCCIIRLHVSLLQRLS